MREKTMKSFNPEKPGKDKTQNEKKQDKWENHEHKKRDRKMENKNCRQQ